MLGDLLRKKREELNITLEDVEKGTNIRKLYIKALETEEYDKLPKADIFSKGFIRSYGKFLGLNPDELIEIFLKEKNNYPINDDNQAHSEMPKETIVVPENKKENSSKRTKLSDFANHQQYMERKTINKKKLISIILGIIIVLVLVLVGLSYIGSNSKEDVTPTQTSASIDNTQKNTAKPLNIVANFNEDVWTIVSVDGKEVLSKVVPKGTSITWEADKSISILASNPEALSISLNNGQPQPLAKSKTEVTMIFSVDDKGQVKTEEVNKAEKVEATSTKIEVEKKVVEPVKNQPVPTPKVENKTPQPVKSDLKKNDKPVKEEVAVPSKEEDKPKTK